MRKILKVVASQPFVDLIYAEELPSGIVKKYNLKVPIAMYPNVGDILECTMFDLDHDSIDRFRIDPHHPKTWEYESTER